MKTQIVSAIVTAALIYSCGPSNEELKKIEQEKQAAIDSILQLPETSFPQSNNSEKATVTTETSKAFKAFEEMNSLMERKSSNLNLEQQLEKLIRLQHAYDNCIFSDSGCTQNMKVKVEGVHYTNVKVLCSNTIYKLKKDGTLAAEIFMPLDSLCVSVYIANEQPKTEFSGKIVINKKERTFKETVSKEFITRCRIVDGRSFYGVDKCNTTKQSGNELFVSK